MIVLLSYIITDVNNLLNSFSMTMVYHAGNGCVFRLMPTCRQPPGPGSNKIGAFPSSRDYYLKRLAYYGKKELFLVLKNLLIARSTVYSAKRIGS